MDREDREGSCFSRAARSLRRALSRICRGRSPSPSEETSDEPPLINETVNLNVDYILDGIQTGYRYTCMSFGSLSDSDIEYETPALFSMARVRSFRVHHPPPKDACESLKRPHTDQSPRGETKLWRHWFDFVPDSTSDQHPPGPSRSSAGGSEPITSQDAARGEELHAAAAPPSLQLSTSDGEDPDSAAGRGGPSDEWPGSADPEALTADPYSYLRRGKQTDDGGPSSTLSASRVSPAACSPPTGVQDSAPSSGGGGAEDASEPGGDRDAVVEVEAPVTAVSYPAHGVHQTSPGPGPSGLPRSPSMSSVSGGSADSLPDLLLPGSCEEFTPAICADGDGESYRLQSSCPGLFQCSLTGLVFVMQGGGEVLYRTVPWNRRRLAQLHKKPAGPLFDIVCVQRSVCQLHLPHCETSSSGSRFLSVAHVTDEVMDFIGPQKVTETHVIIDITGLSAFGNVKDEDSPPLPVRALVLLFYRPPADPDPKSLLNVLLLPRNVVLRDVLQSRKKVVGDEIYIETSPHCKLLPGQQYSLSTCPEDDSVLVQPKKAEFDEESYDDYYPTFQVRLKKILTEMKVLLGDTCSSPSVWESEVSLPSGRAGGSCGRAALDLPPQDRLLHVRSGFIDGISGPVLKSLLDRLLEKKVLADSEREAADVMPDRRDRARFVLDTVRKKGEAASSEMVEFLCEADPFLCERLGLV